MAVETRPETNQTLKDIVAEAEQLRRTQRINLGIAVGSLVAIGAMEIAHQLFSAPHSETQVLLLELGAGATAFIGAIRAVGCEFQGENLDFRAIVATMEEASRRSPTLSDGPESI